MPRIRFSLSQLSEAHKRLLKAQRKQTSSGRNILVTEPYKYTIGPFYIMFDIRDVYVSTIKGIESSREEGGVITTKSTRDVQIALQDGVPIPRGHDVIVKRMTFEGKDWIFLQSSGYVSNPNSSANILSSILATVVPIAKKAFTVYSEGSISVSRSDEGGEEETVEYETEYEIPYYIPGTTEEEIEEKRTESMTEAQEKKQIQPYKGVVRYRVIDPQCVAAILIECIKRGLIPVTTDEETIGFINAGYNTPGYMKNCFTDYRKMTLLQAAMVLAPGEFTQDRINEKNKERLSRLDKDELKILEDKPKLANTFRNATLNRMYVSFARGSLKNLKERYRVALSMNSEQAKYAYVRIMFDRATMGTPHSIDAESWILTALKDATIIALRIGGIDKAQYEKIAKNLAYYGEILPGFIERESVESSIKIEKKHATPSIRRFPGGRKSET